MVYFRMGRMEEALADLDAALEVSPMQGASLYLRGVVRRRTGDIKGSDADLAAARLMWPRVDEDYARYGIK
ncbi:tetratricopeptide repeat protein, partial [Escherichia coli]|uniref:tetratricopeptide repeat protein n=12 Tax=Pseudomonadota TaxID=1224 RepID=UPI001952BCD1